MQKLSLINKYQTYPKYKNSGVEWVGDVPEKWDVTRAKNVFRRNSRPVRDEDEIVTAFRDGTVTLRKNRREDGFTFAEHEIGYQGVRKGDLVIHGMDAFAGAIGVSDSDGKSSPVYAVCTPRTEADTKFHMYLLRHMSKTGYLTAIARGIRERSTEFKWNQYGNMIVVNPPKEEQEKIARFLDEQNARIDETIAKKERLIELLKEKRTATINHAVTKGLDPKAELLDSGIDWIGKIPKGWEVKKLKSGFTFEKGKEAGKFTQEYVSAEKNVGEFPVYSGQTENEGVLGRINTYIYDYPDGVLFSTTVGAKAMTVRLLKDKFSLSQNCVLMVPKNVANPEYFTYLLEIGFLRMRDEIPSHMQPSLRVSDLNKFTVLFPSIEQQIEIANYLREKDQLFNFAIAKLNSSITHLKELKSSLISHAVTGKIKI